MKQTQDSPSFALTIALGNAEMQTGANIARALRYVAAHIDDTNQYFDDPADESGFDRTGRIWDENGNNVGSWQVTP